MVFSTNLFLFLFLPSFLLVYYLLPLSWRNVWILVASFVFYAWWRVDFALLFFATMLWTYLIGKRIANSESPKRAKRFLPLGLVGNLGTLAYFNLGSRTSTPS